ncbi:MAG: hypothetical protein ACI97A_002046 [Planctomycetota bacterium]
MLTIQSYQHHGHDFHLYTYEDVACVPHGTVIKDGGEIVPRHILNSYEGRWAEFSDLFRWTMLFMQGGYWSALNQVCLRAFDFQDELVFGKETTELVAQGVLRFP